MNYEKLKRAPIVEAIIDIRVSPLVVVTKKEILKVREKIGERYPSIETLSAINVPMVGNKIEPPQRTIQGFLVKSIDGAYIGQFRTDGFAFNRLYPYTTWEDIKKNAIDLWEFYKECMSPKQIARVAVRYVNEMRFPVMFENINQFIETTPNLPSSLKTTTKNFLSRAFLEDIDKQRSANITQTIDQNPNLQETIVSLDIDAFSHRRFTLAREKQVWETLEELREMKNDIFFKSLTQKAINNFKS
jgi:uncharacterized protein (TIGR04255 family)